MRPQFSIFHCDCRTPYLWSHTDAIYGCSSQQFVVAKGYKSPNCQTELTIIMQTFHLRKRTIAAKGHHISFSLKDTGCCQSQKGFFAIEYWSFTYKQSMKYLWIQSYFEFKRFITEICVHELSYIIILITKTKSSVLVSYSPTLVKIRLSSIFGLCFNKLYQCGQRFFNARIRLMVIFMHAEIFLT